MNEADVKQKLSLQDNKIVTRLITTINGKSPTHSEVIYVIKFLPEIISIVENKYPGHYSQSLPLNLDVFDKNVALYDQVFITFDDEDPFSERTRQEFAKFNDGIRFLFM